MPEITKRQETMSTDKKTEDFTDQDWHEWRQIRQEIIDSELGLNGETFGNEKYRKAAREYGKANPEKRFKSNKKYRKANPEKVKKWSKKSQEVNCEKIKKRIRDKSEADAFMQMTAAAASLSQQPKNKKNDD